MIDVHLPTTDGRELLLTRYTQPEPGLHWCHECRRGYSAPVEGPLNAVENRYDETTLPKRGRPPRPTNLSW
jgi:hypothetical protein